MSVLKDLYNGEVYPFENIMPQDENYRPISNKVGELRAYFTEKLPQEDKERFAEWNRLICEMLHMEGYANFSYGFRLGVRLMADVMVNNTESEE